MKSKGNGTGKPTANSPMLLHLAFPLNQLGDRVQTNSLYRQTGFAFLLSSFVLKRSFSCHAPSVQCRSNASFDTGPC